MKTFLLLWYVAVCPPTGMVWDVPTDEMGEALQLQPVTEYGALLEGAAMPVCGGRELRYAWATGIEQAMDLLRAQGIVEADLVGIFEVAAKVEVERGQDVAYRRVCRDEPDLGKEFWMVDGRRFYDPEPRQPLDQ